MESTKTSFRLLLVTVIGELDECVLAFGGHVARVLAFGGHVARVGEERGGCIGSWWGDRREGRHWGDLGVDGWIMLGWIFRRWDVGMWTGLDWHRIETGGGRF